jgi:hypothetical protein
MPERPENPLNFCRVCDRDFASLYAFDRHRVGAQGPGDYRGAVEDWSPELGRRCLTETELADAGLELDARGRYCDVARRDEARRHFGRELPKAA